MSSALYIVLERKIPGADGFVNGRFLARHNNELGEMAKRLGIKPLMSFFSMSNEELSSLEEEYTIDLGENRELRTRGLRQKRACAR